MIPPFQRDMAKATELTRAGKLQEATDLIRRLLQGAGAAPTAAGAAEIAPEGVIEGAFIRLEEAPARPDAPLSEPAKAKPARAKRAAPGKTGLAETLRKIAAGGMPAHGPLASAPPVAPGAAFL